MRYVLHNDLMLILQPHLIVLLRVSWDEDSSEDACSNKSELSHSSYELGDDLVPQTFTQEEFNDLVKI